MRKSFRPAQLARFKHAQALLLDGFDANHWGGTGKTFDWSLARRRTADARIFLAGGITPENVAEAIRTARPYAVDVCSGVEVKARQERSETHESLDAGEVGRELRKGTR